VDEEAGGVLFAAELPEIYAANLHLRTASRVLVHLGDFYAAAFSELRKKAARLAWEKFLRPGEAVALRVTCHKSRLYHSDAVAERVAGAIADRLGAAPLILRWNDAAEGSLPQLVIVRLVNDRCFIRIDSSGALLHRRGYRQAVAKAPLRETLAAGMLLLAGWEGRSPLLDPFCGSGTIAIEAALMACRMAPGRARRFAFMDWPGFDGALWQRLLSEAEANRQACPTVILAADRDAGAVAMAQANAVRAGVAEWIRFDCQAVSASLAPQSSGWVVTNPPYGVRVSSGKDLRNLYAQFGNVLRDGFADWKVAVLCGEPALLRATNLHFEQQLRLVNGGLKVSLALGSVEGTNGN
jgi:putative N6-adenine-specific DNA methylase